MCSSGLVRLRYNALRKVLKNKKVIKRAQTRGRVKDTKPHIRPKGGVGKKPAPVRRGAWIHEALEGQASRLKKGATSATVLRFLSSAVHHSDNIRYDRFNT